MMMMSEFRRAVFRLTFDLQCVTLRFFSVSSEANDLALRLARAHTGHKDVIALEG